MEEIFTMHILHEQQDEKAKKVVIDKVNEIDKFDETDDINEINANDEIEFVEWDCCRDLAQAYICHQPLEEVFSPAQGLQHGTAFPNLYQPYMGRLVVPPCTKERL